MKRLKSVFLICVLGLVVHQNSIAQLTQADQPQYAATKISPNLLKGASIVVRKDSSHLRIQSIGEGVFTTSYVYTILNEAGDHFANFTVFYNKLSHIDYMRAAVYDANGKFVRRIKQRDVQDYSSADGFSLYTDNRVKYAKLRHNTYPYTIKCEYAKTYNGLLFFPGWHPQTSQKMSVERSSFTVFSLLSHSFRYKAINLEKATKTPEQNGVQTWSIAQLPAAQPIPYKKQTSFPRLLLAPNYFEIEGFKGNMQSWNSFGKWINQLNANRDEVSPETTKKLKAMTSKLSSIEDKIKVVYNYLQQNTRYVSIQLGIGGWQPFKALTVDQKGYGDCKALSNYMYALLKKLGIASFYTLVKAGKNKRPIQTDFPSSQFNHVILCVPTAKDTIWLECTSQSESFGYMGSFTGDREVLLATPQGGKIVRTPVYDQSVNTLHRQAQVTIAPDGNATAKIQTKYKAIQSEAIAWLISQAPEVQKKWLYEHLQLTGFEIAQYQLTLKKDRLPVGTETLQLNIRRLASKSGKRLFLKPNLMNRYRTVPPTMKDRSSDIYISSVYAFTDIDSISYQVPEKYDAEYKPAPIKFSNEFGSYKMKVFMDGRKITYVRKMVVNAGTFPKEKYQEMVKFYKQVTKADKEMVVLVSGT
ncbi:DUF3857 domain-containing protein [uncultured Microscilla sp.]|uniref:DUF3857 domain-containing protein n=1 Tax=uncultured Microscilla sp. TaxID=432653 RepID=UPI002611D4FB|nr:DUF3857 domain-containing protein [uncultured Microscilla sp.]